MYTSPDRTYSEWRNGAFAALTDDGRIIEWGESFREIDLAKDALDDGSIYLDIFSAETAFAAMRNDGIVFSWGEKIGNSGVTIDIGDEQIVDIAGGSFGFVGLTESGGLYVWGNGGLDPEFEVSGIQDIYSGSAMYAGIVDDGRIFSVTGLGPGQSIDNGYIESDRLAVDIVSTPSTFLALNDDGTVISWATQNGAQEFEPNFLASTFGSNNERIYANQSGFASIKHDGSVISVGMSGYRDENSNPVYEYDLFDSNLGGKANRKAIDIASTYNAFAVLYDDGTVDSWGDPLYGNWGYDSSNVQEVLENINSIYSNGYSFAAVNNEGQLVTWGSDFAGGDEFQDPSQFNSPIKSIYSSYSAYAALLEDGTVYSWGDEWSGGNNELLDDINLSLVDVERLFTSDGGFTALTGNGSYITWGSGNHDDAANLKSINEQLNSYGKLNIADIYRDKEDVDIEEKAEIVLQYAGKEYLLESEYGSFRDLKSILTDDPWWFENQDTSSSIEGPDELATHVVENVGAWFDVYNDLSYDNYYRMYGGGEQLPIFAALSQADDSSPLVSVRWGTSNGYAIGENADILTDHHYLNATLIGEIGTFDPGDEDKVFWVNSRNSFSNTIELSTKIYSVGAAEEGDLSQALTFNEGAQTLNKYIRTNGAISADVTLNNGAADVFAVKQANALDGDNYYVLDVDAKANSDYNINSYDISLGYDKDLFEVLDVGINGEFNFFNSAVVDSDNGTVRVVGGSAEELGDGLGGGVSDGNTFQLLLKAKHNDTHNSKETVNAAFTAKVNSTDTVLVDGEDIINGASDLLISNYSFANGFVDFEATNNVTFATERSIGITGGDQKYTSLLREGSSLDSLGTFDVSTLGNITAAYQASIQQTATDIYTIDFIEGQSVDLDQVQGIASYVDGSINSYQLRLSVEGSAGDVIDLSETTITVSGQDNSEIHNETSALSGKNLITYQSDINYDGRVSMMDLAYLNAGAGQASDASINDVDVNYDKVIDLNDLQKMDEQWGDSLHANNTISNDEFTGNNDTLKLFGVQYQDQFTVDNSAFTAQNAIESTTNFVGSLADAGNAGYSSMISFEDRIDVVDYDANDI